MTATSIEFQISSVGYDADKGHYCRISAPKAFSQPKVIYGPTAEEAAANARRFIAVLASGDSRTAPVAAGVTRVLPAAAVATAADGPLPIGDVVAALLIVGTAAVALLSSRSSDREARCDAQYAADSARCRSLRSPSNRGKCWASAAERYAACLAGRDPKPLRTR